MNSSIAEFAEASEFNKFEGETKILSISIGKGHSLLLSQNLQTSKKYLHVIGGNSNGVFGYKDSPPFSEQLLEIPTSTDLLRDKKIWIQNFSKVKATIGNSFVGEWEDLQDKEMRFCNQIPHYLSDLVCSGHGLCTSAGKCQFRFFFSFNFFILLTLFFQMHF